MNVARFDNARSGVVPSGVWFVVPAILAVFGLSGVTWKPVLGLRDARAELALANERAQERDRASEELRGFDAGNGEARLDAALAAVADLIPEHISSVDVSAMCGLIAQRHGIELSNVVVGAPQDTELVQLSDRIVRSEVEIRGLATPSQIVRMAPDLRSAGFPTDVLELSFSRRDASDTRFSFRLVLGLFHRAPCIEPETPEVQSEVVEKGHE